MTSAPKATLLQGGSNDLDTQLTRRARLRRAKVRWWWGIRKWQVPSSDGADLVAAALALEPAPLVWVNGAWCYLCDKSIVTWSSRWRPTEQAKAAIALHRSKHIQGRLDAPRTRNGDER